MIEFKEWRLMKMTIVVQLKNLIKMTLFLKSITRVSISSLKCMKSSTRTFSYSKIIWRIERRKISSIYAVAWTSTCTTRWRTTSSNSAIKTTMMKTLTKMMTTKIWLMSTSKVEKINTTLRMTMRILVWMMMTMAKTMRLSK